MSRIFYSPSVNGFFLEGSNPIIPSDSVEISEQRHNELTLAQPNGKEIVPGPDGYPILVDPAPPTEQQVIKMYTDAMASHFDSVAHQKNYDNRVTCSLRAGYTGPFQAEGLAFAQWMDSCNVIGYQILDQVKSGQIVQPTIQEFLEMLPSFSWPE